MAPPVTTSFELWCGHRRRRLALCVGATAIRLVDHPRSTGFTAEPLAGGDETGTYLMGTSHDDPFSVH